MFSPIQSENNENSKKKRIEELTQSIASAKDFSDESTTTQTLKEIEELFDLDPNFSKDLVLLNIYVRLLHISKNSLKALVILLKMQYIQPKIGNQLNFVKTLISVLSENTFIEEALHISMITLKNNPDFAYNPPFAATHKKLIDSLGSKISDHILKLIEEDHYQKAWFELGRTLYLAPSLRKDEKFVAYRLKMFNKIQMTAEHTKKTRQEELKYFVENSEEVFSLNDNIQVVKALEELFLLAPNSAEDPVLLLKYGMALQLSDVSLNALLLFIKLLFLYPNQSNNATVVTTIISVLSSLKFYSLALEISELAISKNSDFLNDYMFLIKRAALFFILNQNEKALEAVDRASSLNKDLNKHALFASFYREVYIRALRPDRTQLSQEFSALINGIINFINAQPSLRVSEDLNTEMIPATVPTFLPLEGNSNGGLRENANENNTGRSFKRAKTQK